MSGTDGCREKSMTTIERAGITTGARGGILDREHTIATPGFNCGQLALAPLCIHLCIGMAYGFSVFWLPLSRAFILPPAWACGADMSLLQELFATTCDWRI